jgi:hypothetical protein
MENARLGLPAKKIVDDNMNTTDLANAFKQLDGFLNDPSDLVRLKSIETIAKLGELYDSQSFAIEKTSSLLSDPSPIVRIRVFGILNQFSSGYFNEESKNNVRLSIDRTNPYAIKLAGFLDLNDQAKVLERLIHEPLISNTSKLACQMALARMNSGDHHDILLNKAMGRRLHEDTYQAISMVLLYLRSKESLDYLVDIIHTTEKECVTLNPISSEMVPCGYRAMEALATVVDAFPIKLRDGGDLEVEDFDEAIDICKKWFKKNKKTYKIITNTY